MIAVLYYTQRNTASQKAPLLYMHRNTMTVLYENLDQAIADHFSIEETTPNSHVLIMVSVETLRKLAVAAYDIGYREADNDYKTVVEEEKKYSFNEGYNEGYDEGKDEGLEKGHDRGYKEGYDEGYREGLEEGNTAGIDEGYNRGYDAA